MIDDLYLIWSCEHAGFWRPFGMGYTKRPEEAWRVLKHTALEKCRDALPGWRHEWPPEIPVRLADLQWPPPLPRRPRGVPPDVGFVCKACGITVLGDSPDGLCAACQDSFPIEKDR